ncbi:MucBP domain-containing protein [Enterococcus termitis]|uniref:Uncharacterized protein n=1 Tax=Enterococcus termitis TaxID=332950 RepID=A0A1E5GD29_9ENTE|nr:MucBP domain-containing protein [Enterococcus termitis]OEG10561.1 hypothetical protein BCR25_08815 [Enterococcus termitis]
MKKIHSFKLYFLIILLSFVLVVQPTLIIYYAKGEEEQHWELVNSSNVYEGQFSEDTQEVVFVYRKKKNGVPSQLITVEPTTTTLPSIPKHTSHYGELLRSFSGIFLFGSARF